MITRSERKELQTAKLLLENPGLAARISSMIGTPIEKGLALLPDNWNRTISDVTRSALMKAMEAAVLTMHDAPGEPPSNRWHKLGVAVSGGVGGFFGLTGLAVELPISTTIMLRSFADIARGEGESIDDEGTRLACLEVFALGGGSSTDDYTDSGYYAVRTALAKSIAEASEYVLSKAVADETAPALVRAVAAVAERFGIQVTQKAAAQAIPAIGAAGGAIINTLFMDHYQDMARGHFVVRRLERKHGIVKVQKLYGELPAA